MSYRTRSLIGEINDVIKRTIGDKLFYWGSLQINEDSVSQCHRDKLNEGLSLCILAGKFTGGAFKMKDGSISCSKPGSVVAFDGTKEHRSESFTGKRYSIIAFLHSTTQDIDVKSSSSWRDVDLSVPKGADRPPRRHQE